jgi:hypothetical protein
MALVDGRARCRCVAVLRFPDELVFGDEGPVKLTAAFLQQVFAGPAELSLVVEPSLPNWSSAL